MTNKKFCSGMLIMALVFGTAIIGCDTGNMNAGPNEITYTVEANGTVNEETSTQLYFTFSSAVSDLTVENIDIFSGTGEAEVNQIKGNLIGSGTNWTLSITKVKAGKIRVSIDKAGIERGRKTVFVYKDSATGEDANRAIKLTSKFWEEENIATGGAKWYKFEAEEGTEYRVQWKDNNSPSEDYSAWIRVTVYRSDGTTIISTYGGNNVNGYRDPKPVSGVSGTVYLKVERLYRDGKYAIRFYEPAGMPQVFITVDSARATVVPSIAVKWYVKSLSATNEINVSGFKVYRSNTETGTYTQIGENYPITDFPLSDYQPTTDAGKIIYIDKNVTVGNTYWYRVSAYNSDGEEGDMSDQKQSEAVPGPTSVPLTIGADKTEGTMDTVTQVDWYTFTAESGKTYRVQWESAVDNPVGWYRGGFADIWVSVFTNDRELIDFKESYGNGYSSGWTTPGTVSGVSGTVYLKLDIREKQTYSLGKYSIKVYEE